MVAQPLLHLQLFVFLCNLYMLLCVSFQPNCIPLIPLDLHLQGPVAYSAYGIIDHCQCQVHSVEHPQHLQSQVFQFVVPISWVCMKPTLVVGPVDSEMSNDIRVVCHVNLDKACGGGGGDTLHCNHHQEAVPMARAGARMGKMPLKHHQSPSLSKEHTHIYEPPNT